MVGPRPRRCDRGCGASRDGHLPPTPQRRFPLRVLSRWGTSTPVPGILHGSATEVLHAGALVKAFVNAIVGALTSSPGVDGDAFQSQSAVYLLPGARMVGLFYTPLVSYLAGALQGKTRIYPPHARLPHVGAIASYLSAIRDDLRQGGNFLVAHSLGGFAALKQLHDTPDLVERVILIETPCEAGELSPAIRWALKVLEGIDLETARGPLAFLGPLKSNRGLVRKISIIATRQPTFVPVEAYLIKGADVHLIDDSTHALLPHAAAALATIAGIVTREIEGSPEAHDARPRAGSVGSASASTSRAKRSGRSAPVPTPPARGKSRRADRERTAVERSNRCRYAETPSRCRAPSRRRAVHSPPLA